MSTVKLQVADALGKPSNGGSRWTSVDKLVHVRTYIQVSILTDWKTNDSAEPHARMYAINSAWHSLTTTAIFLNDDAGFLDTIMNPTLTERHRYPTVRLFVRKAALIARNNRASDGDGCGFQVYAMYTYEISSVYLNLDAFVYDPTIDAFR